MQLVIVEVIVDNSGGDVAEGLAEVTEGVKVIVVMGELFAS